MYKYPQIEQLYPQYNELASNLNNPEWKKKVEVFEDFGRFIKHNSTIFQQDVEAVIVYLGMASKDFKIANAIMLKSMFEIASVAIRCCCAGQHACKLVMTPAITKV